MSDIATHMRITGLQVTNDDVDSRSAAVAALKTAWGKITATENILSKAADVASAISGDGVPSVALGTEVQTAIQKRASAFLYNERPFDVGIVASSAALGIMSDEPHLSGWVIADVWAAALWSVLGFQQPLEDPKREALRVQILETARIRSTSGSEVARRRVAVGEFKKVELVAGEEEKFSSAFEKATASTIDALRRNSALDREELDFLWWSLRGRSRLLGKAFSGADGVVSAVAAGIEAASQLRRLPCEVHHELVLAKLTNNPKVDLVELLARVGEDRSALGDPFADGFVARHPSVFPLLHALATGNANSDYAAVKRSAEEWAGRGLLEAGLETVLRNGPAKI
ncbi:hypothetical protein J8N08_22920 (plasmid) [Agrobacterium tumefaciens]|uniref:GTPase-associated system helical domain-containing protein n=1 Tax=Agrobacterium tumefaciens TaxID=358 RepID=A0AAE6ENM7_AGRTU|nr:MULTISPECIES: GTPase-associated system all-helical protein GASH [Agrobacterium]KNY31828.1 hypothetical protein AKG12_22825 [Agrobacterium sp. SUL3]MCA2372769.1 hypothetical protein [Agrobacterium tomkonis CIP 111-78]QCM03754.1 hypothetical protein CFBP6624_26645 [Agrobacterium tumefaciens]QTQ86088.1 hypothetical protein J8N08_22920 [Agrobacterium tumefaciens]